MRTSIEHEIDHMAIFYLKYTTGAKFKQRHSNISRDILDFVIYLSNETICDVISF